MMLWRDGPVLRHITQSWLAVTTAAAGLDNVLALIHRNLLIIVHCVDVLV